MKRSIILLALVSSGIFQFAHASKYKFDPKGFAFLSHSEKKVSLQTFLDRPEDTLVLPAALGGYSTGPLYLRRNHVVLILLPGVELRAAPGAFPRPKKDCLLTLTSVEDATLIGYGARLVMRKEEYLTGEWRHALKLLGCKRVHIQGFGIDSSGGDGIYIGSLISSGRHASEDIRIEDCTLRGHRRQGISVISVRGLRMSRSTLEGTQGTPPECGIDFEPDGATESLHDIVVRDCIFKGNTNHGALVWLGKLKSSSDPVSIVFDSCRFLESIGGAGMQLSGFRDKGIRGQIRFRKCLWSDNANQDLVVLDKSPNGLDLVLDTCLIRHKIGKMSPKERLPKAVFAFGRNEGDWIVGGIISHGLRIEKDVGVPLFRDWSDKHTRFKNISLDVDSTTDDSQSWSEIRKELPQGVNLTLGHSSGAL